MTYNLKPRLLLTAQIGVLIASLVGLGSAPAAYAADTATDATRPEMTVWAQRTETKDYRDEVQADARVVVWKTRYSALSDLELKLNNNEPSDVRLAGNFSDKRG